MGRDYKAILSRDKEKPLSKLHINTRTVHVAVRRAVKPCIQAALLTL